MTTSRPDAGVRPSGLRERIAASLIWPMLRKEFIQMRRDRLTLGMMVGLPAIQLMLFGYAVRTEVRHLPTVVLDESRTSESRALVSMLQNTRNFDVSEYVHTRLEVEDRIRSGAARAALIIPPDYSTDIKRGRTAQAQVIVDAADPLASGAALSGAAMVGSARSAELMARRGLRVESPLEIRVRPWYNPALRSSSYIVPGLVGTLLSMTMLLITSMAIVRERERGTLEQLIVTPIDKTSLMLGKIIPFVLVGFVQMSVVLALGKLLFHIPIRGSLLQLYLVTTAFIVANLGIGLLISTVAKTQLQAMQMGFFIMMPSFLLSGFMFPREAMPVVARWLGLVLPLTYYLTILRGVLLKGVGVEYLWRESLTLLIFAVVIVAMSVRRFTKRME